MSANPPFSVVIPLYNGSRYISDAITSVRQQTVGEPEILVVDDGSTDDGPDIVASHPAEPKLIRQRQSGVAAARNRGSLESRGDWLAFLDQDDLWHDSRLERIAPHLDPRGPQLVLTTLRSFGLISDRAKLRSNGPLIEGMVDVWIDGGTELSQLCGADPAIDLTGTDLQRTFTKEDLMKRTVTTTTSFFIRKDYLTLLGGWSLHARSIDDWWLMANAARLQPITEIDQPTQLYRIHGAATSRDTKFWYPYSTSLLALRFGSQMERLEDALGTGLNNPTLRHMLTQLVESEEYHTEKSVRVFAKHMAALLWPDGSAAKTIRRAELQRKAPWLLNSVRQAKGLVARVSSRGSS